MTLKKEKPGKFVLFMATVIVGVFILIGIEAYIQDSLALAWFCGLGFGMLIVVMGNK